MKKLRYYIGKHAIGYIIGVTAVFVAVALDAISPQISKRIINDVFVGGNYKILPYLLAGIAGVGIIRSIFQYLKEFTFDKNCGRISTEMRKDLFSYIQGLSVDFFDKTNTGELMARVKDDIDKIWGALGYISFLLIEVTVHVILVLFCMFRLSIKLTFIPLACMAVCGFLAIFLEKKLGPVYEEISDADADLTTTAEENLMGVRTVRAFVMEEFEKKKFFRNNKRYCDLNMKQSKVMVRYYPYFQLVGIMLPVTCAILGGVEVVHGRMDLGSLVAYIEYSRNCTWPMEMIGWLTNEFTGAIASWKKIQKVCANVSSIKEKDDAKFISDKRGCIAFEHVTFKSEEKTILRDISFTLPKGKTLGIMGATGSGKTSIVNVLQRFYDPVEGRVTIDGIDVKDMKIADVRRTCAVVMQESYLFSDTIAENINMGKRGQISAEATREAAKMSEAYDFITKTEDGFDTVIGERGVGLSGGQKQRINIARAIAKEAPVLVLDDSTSALDMETEHKIQVTLNEQIKSSRIIIAHRISSVRYADEILFLNEGEIAERGTHEELMALQGLYYKTYVAQYGAMKMAE